MNSSKKTEHKLFQTILFPLKRIYAYICIYIQYICTHTHTHTRIYGFPYGSEGKQSDCNARDTEDVGLIPGLGRSPGGGKWQPIPVFLPEKSTDRGAWRATVQRVTKSWT